LRSCKYVLITTTGACILARGAGIQGMGEKEEKREVMGGISGSVGALQRLSCSTKNLNAFPKLSDGLIRRRKALTFLGSHVIKIVDLAVIPFSILGRSKPVILTRHMQIDIACALDKLPDIFHSLIITSAPPQPPIASGV
jgi:hypothetical protein